MVLKTRQSPGGDKGAAGGGAGREKRGELLFARLGLLKKSIRAHPTCAPTWLLSCVAHPRPF